MVQIVEVKTKKQIHDFVDYPNKLYKGVKWYVPPMFGDELKTFDPKKFSYADVVESVHFLAYRDNKIVGRIEGFIQKQSNEKTGEKRMRFTRFDSINDKEVSRALFSAIIEWGKAKGMEKICGPLGYSDLEREGLLIEGFDQLSTFAEQYNYDYYQELIEDVGLTKEVDWFESKLSYKNDPKTDAILDKLSDRVLKGCGLRIVNPNDFTKKAYINRYKDGFFHCIDECYSHLYGTVEFTEPVKKSLIDQFNMILNKKYIVFIVDKEDKVVACGLCFPALGPAFQKSGGRITLPSLLRLFKAVNFPSVIELGLIAVLPEYQKLGVNAAFLKIMNDELKDPHIKYMETNLNLEDNIQVISQWKHYNREIHKKRRSYVKNI